MSIDLIHALANRCVLKTSCLSVLHIVLMNALLVGTVELHNLNDIESVFDDSFFSQLDESHFDICPEQLFREDFPKHDQKRKRNAYEDDTYLLKNYNERNTEYMTPCAGGVSAAYDIERTSPVEPLPKKKRMRGEVDFVTNDFVISGWDSHSDDSWDMLPAVEDSPISAENDSWRMPSQPNMNLPYASEAKNPIGHILSNGIRSFHNESKTNYGCRSCGKDLKGHQHNPTMHFMLPKHENCWQKVTEDMHLSENISNALYPPQYMDKTSKKDVYRCKKCGQNGSRRKILSHVMGAKCKQLRKTYSDALAWNGIEDLSSESSVSNIKY